MKWIHKHDRQIVACAQILQWDISNEHKSDCIFYTGSLVKGILKVRASSENSIELYWDYSNEEYIFLRDFGKNKNLNSNVI